jgi:hypothetical protein
MPKPAAYQTPGCGHATELSNGSSCAITAAWSVLTWTRFAGTAGGEPALIDDRQRISSWMLVRTRPATCRGIRRIDNHLAIHEVMPMVIRSNVGGWTITATSGIVVQSQPAGVDLWATLKWSSRDVGRQRNSAASYQR